MFELILTIIERISMLVIIIFSTKTIIKSCISNEEINQLLKVMVVCFSIIGVAKGIQLYF